MKKIIVTAKEQWDADLRKCVAEGGNIDNNPESYKVVDDSIGIINENELYHIYDDYYDHFFLKVGDKYSHVWTAETPVRLLWNNAENLDFNESWFDKEKVITFLKESNVDELMDGSPIEFYQLIWMGIWGSETYCHEYEDCEKDVEDEESVPTPDTPKNIEVSVLVEDVVQELRDTLSAQKKVVWSLIKNLYTKQGKNIDMGRMPSIINDAAGYGYNIEDCGHLFYIAERNGKVVITFIPNGDIDEEVNYDGTFMSYEALIGILYAMK